MEEKLLDINNEDLKFKIDSITFESKIDKLIYFASNYWNLTNF